MDTLATTIVKSIFSRASQIAPTLTGSLAFKLFCRPHTPSNLSAEQQQLANAGLMKLGDATPMRIPYADGSVQAYVFTATDANASRGTVILVHGWTSESRYMTAFVDPLRELGFDVVCFDLPAHGKSSGFLTTPLDCARALRLVAAQFTDVYGIIAHSFGGSVAALALAGSTSLQPGLNVDKIVLLAAPDESAEFARRFGEGLGLNPDAQRGFEIEFETVCECPLRDFTGTKYFGRVDRPMLVLHSEDDTEVPYEQGLHYCDLPQCQFVSLALVGHRDILYAPQVIDNVSAFMVS
jgi:pimeloyl-ACP methyl ester carboxylesterase